MRGGEDCWEGRCEVRELREEEVCGCGYWKEGEVHRCDAIGIINGCGGFVPDKYSKQQRIF